MWRLLILGLVTFLSFRLFCVTLSFPFAKLPLPFLGFVICNDVGKNASGDRFNSMLRNTGIVLWVMFASHKFLIPPGRIKFSRCSWGCAYGRRSMAVLLFDEGLFDTGIDLCRSSRQKLRNENADTCQAIAFLCLHVFILLCVNIIPKATNPVKEITGGYAGGKSVTLLAKKCCGTTAF